MPLLECCGFGRTISPDPQPIRLIDSVQPKARFALSSHSLTPVKDPQRSRAIHKTSQAAFEDNGPQISSVASGHDLRPLHGAEDAVKRSRSSRKLQSLAGKVHEGMPCDPGIAERIVPKGSSDVDVLNIQSAEVGVYRRHSSRTLHGVAGKIRKRMSRDSEISRRSSMRLPRNSLSLDNMDRRAELRRALHRRVKVRLDDIFCLIGGKIRGATHVSTAYAPHVTSHITYRLTASLWLWWC
jgi:hypothetical protein